MNKFYIFLILFAQLFASNISIGSPLSFFKKGENVIKKSGDGYFIDKYGNHASLNGNTLVFHPYEKNESVTNIPLGSFFTKFKPQERDVYIDDTYNRKSVTLLQTEKVKKAEKHVQINWKIGPPLEMSYALFIQRSDKFVKSVALRHRKDGSDGEYEVEVKYTTIDSDNRPSGERKYIQYFTMPTSDKFISVKSLQNIEALTPELNTDLVLNSVYSNKDGTIAEKLIKVQNPKANRPVTPKDDPPEAQK